MILLGIDYGTKRIGLALADGFLVTPLGVVKNSLLSPSASDHFLRIKLICQQNSVEKIILGLPEGWLLPKVKEFGRTLAGKTGLPVIYQEETLTTQDAIAKMKAAGRKKKFRKQKMDAVAAAVILQSYLNFHV